MDVATVATSALLSVTLSVFAASRVAMRQERGKARQQTLDALRELVVPRWREARRHELGMSKPTRPNAVHNGDDFMFASRVLSLSARLPWWRQWLIRRRLRRLIGRMWVDQLEVQPMDDSSPGAALAPMLTAQFRERESPRYKDKDRAGLYWTALSEGSDETQMRLLRQQLGRLARGF